jgi:CHAT domain-containing protein
MAADPAPTALVAQRAADAVIRGALDKSYTPLPGTRAEVQTIARLFPANTSQLLLGPEASEEALATLATAGQLAQFRYLHLATHGELNPSRGMYSSLILAHQPSPDDRDRLVSGTGHYDGRLTAADILSGWKLDADLVTLSACQSALGRHGGGEGYLGFSQALLLSGARSLVLSLWKVDDTATALLMVRFYENLLGRRAGLSAPMPKAQALAEAKSWLRGLTFDQRDQLVKDLKLSDTERGKGIGTAKGPARPSTAARPYEHPYYWSAFILIGDPL